VSDSTKGLRAKYGVTKAPIQASRVLVKTLDASHFKQEASAIIAINDEAGTFTAVNCYGEGENAHTGKSYDPTSLTHPLPPEGSEKFKEWAKRGYRPGVVSEIGILAPIGAAVTA